MTLLVKNFKTEDTWIKLKHKDIKTGEFNGSNLCVVLDYLHENFSRREVRKILIEGDFEAIK